MKWIIGIGAIVLLAAGITLVFVNPRFQQKGKVLGAETFYQEQNRVHIQPGEDHPLYSSNPPTSGWHWPNPADWGMYDTELPDEQLIHNLEHGGINIFYKDIDEETLKKLKDIAGRYKSKVVLAPRSQNPTKFALVAWEYLDTFEDFDEERIVRFIQANINRGPEYISD